MSRCLAIVALFSVTLASHTAAGIIGEIVVDITDAPYGNLDSRPRDFATLPNGVFVTFRDPYLLTPGETPAVRLIRKLGPGTSEPDHAFSFGGLVLFQAEAGDFGRELYVTDGTSDGTVLLGDLNPGGEDSRVDAYEEFQDRLFLQVSKSARPEIWSTDGTPAGTERLFEPSLGQEGFRTTDFAIASGGLFFAWDKGGDLRPYVTDGTTTGTQVVRDDLLFGGFSAEAMEFGVLDDMAWFIAFENGKRRLYKSDGTATGTVPVEEVTAGYEDMIQLADGFALVLTDSEGFYLQVFRNPDGSSHRIDFEGDPRYVESFFVNQFHLGLHFFAIEDRVNDDFQLWRTDGSEAGTFLIAHNASAPIGSCNGRYFFTTVDEDDNLTISVTDGTFEGTAAVHQGTYASDVGLPYGACFEDVIYFPFDDGIHGDEPWRSDGTPEGTHLYVDYGPPTTDDTDFEWLLPDGSGGIWFETGDDHIRHSTGAPGNQTDLGRFVNSTRRHAASGGRLFFEAVQENAGRELWLGHSDGSVSFVKDVFPGPDHSFVSQLATLGDLLLFTARDGVHGREPWRSDGTSEGTFLLADLDGTPDDTSITSFVIVGSEAWFLQQPVAGSLNFWSTDGSVDGTRIISTVKGFPHTLVSRLTAFDDRMIFFARSSGDDDSEIWVTDGTASGTQFVATVASIEMGPPWTAGRQLMAFAADSAAEGMEPWVTDGTAEGTRLIGDIRPGPEGSRIDGFTVNGQQVYFIAEHHPGEREALYCYDARMQSLTRLSGEDGYFAGSAVEPVVFDGLTMFGGLSGEEPFLWATNGTVRGTVPLVPKSQYPAWTGSMFTPSGRTLYFVGDHHLGTELWSLSRDSVTPFFETNQWITD